jgi:hypothetical protein
MRVDVADPLGLNARILQGVEHHSVSAVTILGWSSDVKGIAAHPITHNFGQNPCSTAAGDFQFFENQNSRAFANHESIAGRVPRPARLLRRIIASGKRTHGAEAADRHRSNRCLGSTRNHDVSITARDDLVRIAYGMRAGSARGAGSLVRAFRPEAYAHVAGGQIDDRGRNEKG